MSEKKERNVHPFVWPAVGIFVTLGLLLALMLMSDRQYGPGQAYLNQNTGGQVYDRDPGAGIDRLRRSGAAEDSSGVDNEPVGSGEVVANEGADEPPSRENEEPQTDDSDEDRLGFYERLSAGLGAAKGFEPGPDAADCEGHCDCPQGHVCRPDIGRCVETEYHPIYCCAQDGCPAGEACVQPNGSEGACGADE